MNPAKLSLSLFLLLATVILVACASGPSTTAAAPLPPTRTNVPTSQPPNVRGIRGPAAPNTRHQRLKAPWRWHT